MSDAHNEHESAIKTPKQLIAAVLAGFLIPIVCIVLLVEYVTNGQTTAAGTGAGHNHRHSPRRHPQIGRAHV